MVLVSADGRFVYAGNRLHETVAVFAVGGDGMLTYHGEEWTRGNYPRSFALDPTGGLLYCCNQRADHVTVFRAAGGLAFTGHYVPVGNPSCVALLDLAEKGRPCGKKAADRGVSPGRTGAWVGWPNEPYCAVCCAYGGLPFRGRHDSRSRAGYALIGRAADKLGS